MFDPVVLVIGATAAAAGYGYAYLRRAKVSKGTMTIDARRIELFSAGDVDAVFRAIAAIGPPYRVDDQLPEQRMLVLSSPPSIWSYGFFYPVIVHETENGCRIELGVKSKFFHVGPGMGRAHLSCAKAIEALLTVPPARVT